MRHLLGRWAIDRYFSGVLGPRAEVGLRAHLRRCDRCSGRYRRHLLAESLLPDGDQLAEERLWRGVRRARAAKPRRHAWVTLALAAAAGTALLLLVPRPRTERAERGASSGALAPPAVHLYRVERSGPATPVGARIARADALLVAYSNPGTLYDRLMVFAVDQRYRVHWFYPPFERPGDDPVAIPIARERAGVELGEAISHDLAPGKLRIYALFLDHPERVSRIEALVATALAGPAVPLERETLLPVTGAHQTTQLLEVGP